MKDEQKEIIKLTTAKFAVGFFEITMSPFFKASNIYKQSTKKLLEQSRYDREEINQRISYLKRMGYIRSFIEKKERYLELTPKGIKKIAKWQYESLNIEEPSIWDGKWRVVIFDIPEKLRGFRDALRFKLYELNFYQIQKSVYVFPFPCTEEIKFITQKFGISKDVTIMISEIIQGEEKMIDYFLKKKILAKKILAISS